VRNQGLRPAAPGARWSVSEEGASCTAGFTGRSRGPSGHYVLLTAGHCLYLNTTLFNGSWDSPWLAKNEAGDLASISDTYAKMFAGFEGKDAGAINVFLHSYLRVPAPAPWVVVKESSTTTGDTQYPIRGDAKSVMGKVLCRSGAVTGTHCAAVSDLGSSITLEGPDGNTYTLHNLGELDMCDALPGDSGGPIYKKNKAYGMHVGAGVGPFSCYEFYQGIRSAQNVLGVDLLVDD
jgi:hypothetical protein